MGILHVLLLNCFVLACCGDAVISVPGTLDGFLKNNLPDTTSIAETNLNIDDGNDSAPETDVTKDGVHYSAPETDVTKDGVHYSAPETDVTKDGVHYSAPETDVTKDGVHNLENNNIDTDYEAENDSIDTDFETENDNSDLDSEDDDKTGKDEINDQDDVKIVTPTPELKGFNNSIPYSKGRRNISISNILSSNRELQRGALVNTKTNPGHTKIDKVRTENVPDSSLTLSDTNGSTNHRKKRVQTTSAAPSVQLIILVVGAVFACVIITGFIRWRVRRRLNERKLRKMSDSSTAYRGKSWTPKKSGMDTIYECECEQGLNISHSHGRDRLEYSEVTQDDDTYQLDETACSHRFDNVSSIDASERLLLSRYSKDGLDSGGRKQKSRHKRHGHKSKYYNHHRRKIQDRTPTLEAVSAEKSIHIVENCENWFLEQADDNTIDVDTTIEKQTLATSSPPPPSPLLEQSSPSVSRGILDSLVDSWRSLSFNRDWVGQMWQEKHNVRRISDVLRGITVTSHPEMEDSQSEELTNDVENANTQVSCVLNTDDTNSVGDKTCSVDNQELKDITEDSLLNDGEVSGNLGEYTVLSENVFPEVDTDRSFDRSGYLDTSSDVRLAEADPVQISSADMFNRFMLFSEQSDEPPGYQSLLQSGSFSMNLLSRSSLEHPRRHHRRHRRKRSEHTERNIRRVYSRIHGDDLSHDDLQGSVSRHEHDQLSHTPIPLDPASVSDVESHTHDTASLTTPNCQSDQSQGQNKSFNNLPSSSSNQNVSTVAAPFVQQEGIVIEQLSDGAQIIYIPPPVLPSYHNDTPPPYQQ